MFHKKFAKLSRLVQFILLLIPFVNWVTEVVVRWSSALEKKEPVQTVIALLVTAFGIAFGWIDMIWVILFGRLTFTSK
jgi:hypothetical protein